jgi:hypothetical protein
MALRPYSPSPGVPQTRKEKIGNNDDEIAAGLGRNRTGAGGVECCRVET